MAKTRGMTMLDRAGVQYTTRTYTHERKGAVFASEALGIPLDQFGKTLVIDADDEPVFVVMRGDAEVSLKKVARLANAKHADLADPARAQRLTGYLVGGISPLGSRRALRVFVDEHLASLGTIAINAGQRGVIITVAADDVIRVLDATVADVMADPAELRRG